MVTAPKDSTEYARAKLAYDTYRAQVADKSPVNGPFDDAAEWVHRAWIAVAAAVAADVSTAAEAPALREPGGERD
jgi:hypothetical protein